MLEYLTYNTYSIILTCIRSYKIDLLRFSVCCAVWVGDNAIHFSSPHPPQRLQVSSFHQPEILLDYSLEKTTSRFTDTRKHVIYRESMTHRTQNQPKTNSRFTECRQRPRVSRVQDHYPHRLHRRSQSWHAEHATKRRLDCGSCNGRC